MKVNEERLRQALRALAQSEMRTPSPDLEKKLLLQVRARKIRSLWPVGTAVLAAAFALAFVLRPTPVTRDARGPALPVYPVEVRHGEQESTHVIRSTKRRPLEQANVEPQPLMRIPYSAPLGDTNRAVVVRVSMPGAQLLAWGFPFPGKDPNSSVNADLLVGEDGLARAVRLVP